MRAIFFFVSATFFWGLNFHLAKIMLQYVNFVEAGFWRYLFGISFLLGVQVISGNTIKGSIDRRSMLGLSLIGFIGLFGFNLLFFLGLAYTSALNAALIVSLNPVLTAILAAWLLNKPINGRQKIGMLIALFGVFYLLTKGQLTQLLEIEWSIGDLLILGANLVFALHHIWVKMYAAPFSNATFTLLTNALCFLGFVLLLPIVGIHAPLQGATAFWLSVFGIGVLGTALAYLFWNRGIAELGAAQAGLFMNIVPLAAAILAIFFGESLYWYHLTSGILILGGMLYLQWEVVVGR